MSVFCQPEGVASHFVQSVAARVVVRSRRERDAERACVGREVAWRRVRVGVRGRR